MTGKEISMHSAEILDLTYSVTCTNSTNMAYHSKYL